MTRFDFYLNNLSFRKTEDLTLQILRDKIEQLSNDCAFMREHNEIIYRHTSIYEEKLIDDHSVMDMLYNPEYKELIGNDYHTALQLIVDHSKLTEIENETIVASLENHSAEVVNGLICFHQVSGINPQYLVYDKNDWFNFHRFFLGIYPVNPSHFFSEIRKYFPSLFFHNRVKESLNSLEPSLSGFCKNVIEALTALEIDFKRFYNPADVLHSLELFSVSCGVETTLEGNAKRKSELTFDFTDDQNNSLPICCDPHMKLSNSDEVGDTRFYYNRIYFHGGHPNIENAKILIGHIGNHL